MTQDDHSTSALKAEARRLRQAMKAVGTDITHAQALEITARQHGFRDWNTASATAPASTPRWQIGQRIRGRYLDQPFTGRIKAATQAAGGFWRLTLVFDTPVDVVRSPRFSNLRRQVNCVINAQGVTTDRTSDGTPQLCLFAA